MAALWQGGFGGDLGKGGHKGTPRYQACCFPPVSARCCASEQLRNARGAKYSSAPRGVKLKRSSWSERAPALASFDENHVGKGGERGEMRCLDDKSPPARCPLRSQRGQRSRWDAGSCALCAGSWLAPPGCTGLARVARGWQRHLRPLLSFTPLCSSPRTGGSSSRSSSRRCRSPPGGRWTRS